MKNIIVLGATGSIGDSVLSVIKQNKNKLNLLGITFSSNIAKAKNIINEFKLKKRPMKSNALKGFLMQHLHHRVHAMHSEGHQFVGHKNDFRHIYP